MDDHIAVGADFHIQVSPSAAALPKLVLKHEETFLVADRHGDFPAFLDGELGFYHEGTRHLRWLELRLNGNRPLLLGAETSAENDQILVTLTNADLPGPAGAVPRNSIHLDRRLALDGARLRQSLGVTSFHDAPATLTLEWIFSADFQDVFEVRGMHRPARGRLWAPERAGGLVRLRYRGLDDVERTSEVRFDPPPLAVGANRALYEVRVAPGETARVTVEVTARAGDAAPPRAPATPGWADGPRRLAAAAVHTDHVAFDALVRRSVVDLSMLLTETGHGRVPYAGVPWYVAPFGRDSVVTAFQLLPYAPEVAAGTLRFLAAWQGRRVEPFTDEEPGKILHEYRRGEMANCREVPFLPYYGTVDATPLFVMLLAEYARWTGDRALVGELMPAAEAALGWLRAHGDRDGDGYVEYATRSALGLVNQGWKDSEDAVAHADGTLARLPIALVEVQGYAYAALRAGAELARLLGAGARAETLEAEAAALRARFNRDFWLEPEGFYALALDGDKRPCEVIASNPGHALWTGIVDDDRAPGVTKRLLDGEMFSGWGIRTLSARERRYNPMSYHNGSVWPHDNAIAAAGFRRYGLTGAVLTVTAALLEASRFFEHARLPELFCGFPRHAESGPVSYPVACAPQAWAAGSVLQLVTAMCGFEADAAGNRLTCWSPVLPPWLRFIEIHGLRVGRSSCDIAITRGRESASVELIARRGDVEVIVRR